MDPDGKEKEILDNERMKTGVSRREFLKGALVTAAVTTVALGGISTAMNLGKTVLAQQQAATERRKYYDNFPSAEEMTRRWAMAIDLRRCIGCHSCVVACKTENNVPLGVFMAWVQNIEKGKYPDVTVAFLPGLCNHCDNPPCVPVCPVKATYKRGDGAVLIDKDICIGCGYCIQACPYDARFFNPISRTADKCTLCDHRINKGHEPACISACPTRARIFGDLNDSTSEVATLFQTMPVQALKPEKGTRPMVLYIALDKNIVGRIDEKVTVLGGGD